jgi:two-component system OmpR family sensor kinase
VSAARPARPRWTLRRRLVAVVVALLATVAAVMGLVSTLALRSSLMTQVDTRLRDASTRAADAPSRLGRGAMPGQLPSGAPADGSGVTTEKPEKKEEKNKQTMKKSTCK